LKPLPISLGQQRLEPLSLVAEQAGVVAALDGDLVSALANQDHRVLAESLHVEEPVDLIGFDLAQRRLVCRTPERPHHPATRDDPVLDGLADVVTPLRQPLGKGAVSRQWIAGRRQRWPHHLCRPLSPAPTAHRSQTRRDPPPWGW
jgi:hypothetical protein